MYQNGYYLTIVSVMYYGTHVVAPVLHWNMSSSKERNDLPFGGYG